MGIVSLVRRGLRHTRIVPSGSPPLYRLNMVGLLVSGIIQAILGDAPQSVSDNTPEYFDWFFIGLQLIGTVAIIGALYGVENNTDHAAKLRRSLVAEFVGLVFLVTVIIVNVVAVMFYNQGPPSAPSTWLLIMFGGWILYTRLPEVKRIIKELS